MSVTDTVLERVSVTDLVIVTLIVAERVKGLVVGTEDSDLVIVTDMVTDFVKGLVDGIGDLDTVPDIVTD